MLETRYDRRSKVDANPLYDGQKYLNSWTLTGVELSFD